MFKSITHRPLWVNILFSLVLAFLIFVLFIFSLKCLTNHGRSRTVPLVVGKSYSEAEKILADGGFEIKLQDSVYVDSLPPLTVIKQLPESDAVVKVNRIVYVTINTSNTPMVEIPPIIGYTYRNAEMTLHSLGLKTDTSYDSDFARNSLLRMEYNDQPIKPGTKVQMGTKIMLVLGSGSGEEVFNVPNLVGWVYGQAKGILESKRINPLIISVEPEVKDTMSAFIIWQDPRPKNDAGEPMHIRAGQVISIKLGLTKPVVVDTLTPGAPPPDQQ